MESRDRFLTSKKTVSPIPERSLFSFVCPPWLVDYFNGLETKILRQCSIKFYEHRRLRRDAFSSLMLLSRIGLSACLQVCLPSPEVVPLANCSQEAPPTV